jgi:hypothetical protein
MSERRNRVGGAYALTVFTPIIAGHEDELRAHIDNLPLGPDSPLARLDRLHVARIQIFDELVYQGPPQKPDRLASKQLLFTNTFDGDLDPYLDELCERIGPEADRWWGHCVGYPGTRDRQAFKRYIRRHKVDTSLVASAFPNATVHEIRHALELRERVAAFAAEAQGLDAATLQQRFCAAFTGGG